MWLPVPGSAGIANKTCTVRLRRILRSAAWRKGVTLVLEDVLTHHELVISDFIAEELVRKLRDKFNFPESEVRELRRFLRRVATAVVPTNLPANVCRDANDIPVLGTAVAGSALVLVTVDKNLLALDAFQGIAIIKPGEFWRRTTG